MSGVIERATGIRRRSTRRRPPAAGPEAGPYRPCHGAWARRGRGVWRAVLAGRPVHGRRPTTPTSRPTRSSSRRASPATSRRSWSTTTSRSRLGRSWRGSMTGTSGRARPGGCRPAGGRAQGRQPRGAAPNAAVADRRGQRAACLGRGGGELRGAGSEALQRSRPHRRRQHSAGTADPVAAAAARPPTCSAPARQLTSARQQVEVLRTARGGGAVRAGNMPARSSSRRA